MDVKKVKSKSDPKEDGQVREQLGYSSNLIPNNVENIDANDGDNVFLTPDYVNDIYAYLRHLEVCLKLTFLKYESQMIYRTNSAFDPTFCQFRGK